MSNRLAELQSSVWGVRLETLALVHLYAAGEIDAEELRERSEGPAPEAAAPPPSPTGTKVAVIPLRGMITPRGSLLGALFGGGGGLEGFRASLARATADESVTSILMRVDSPGGLVEGVPETAAAIREARGTKPIVAVADTMAASAAYWLAAQANEVVMTESGRVGSVGVFSIHEDISGLLEKEGVDLTFIQAGKYKTEGNPYEALGEDAKAAMQERIDEVYGMFVADLAKGRGVTPDTVRSEFGEGRMLSPKAAQKAGMVDRVETFEAAVGRLTRGRSRIRGAGEQNMKLADHLDTAVADAEGITGRVADAAAQRAEGGQELADETQERVASVASYFESCAERLREALAIEPRSEESNDLEVKREVEIGRALARKA